MSYCKEEDADSNDIPDGDDDNHDDGNVDISRNYDDLFGDNLMSELGDEIGTINATTALTTIDISNHEDILVELTKKEMTDRATSDDIVATMDTSNMQHDLDGKRGPSPIMEEIDLQMPLKESHYGLVNETPTLCRIIENITAD